jgi:hypothetical protein
VSCFSTPVGRPTGIATYAFLYPFSSQSANSHLIKGSGLGILI